jgi:4-methyl-5(b-hydroxyethyl)-thiazole monophosphate biosynthesis
MMSQLDCGEAVTDSVVVDGNITTSRGLGTALPFALSLIGQLLSEEKAKEIAASVVWSV